VLYLPILFIICWFICHVTYECAASVSAAKILWFFDVVLFCKMSYLFWLVVKILFIRLIVSVHFYCCDCGNWLFQHISWWRMENADFVCVLFCSPWWGRYCPSEDICELFSVIFLRHKSVNGILFCSQVEVINESKAVIVYHHLFKSWRHDGKG
jgi:hypothetical protein